MYDSGIPGLDDLAAAAHQLAAQVNGLDPTAFPSLLAMENDLVAAAGTLLGGGPGGVGSVVGSVTSGGTESLILAVKAARDARPDVAEPRLVMPVTAHAALAKAGAYLGSRWTSVPVDAATLRVDPAAVAARDRARHGARGLLGAVVRARDRRPGAGDRGGGARRPASAATSTPASAAGPCRTCGGSASTCPRSTSPSPGVTSISVDLHKYAYAPKGVSILLHRDEALRLPQYFAYAGWPGYTMVNPVISSTRSGGPIAAAWATLRRIGDAGYLELASTTLSAVRGLGRRRVGGRTAFGSCRGDSTVVAFTADGPRPVRPRRRVGRARLAHPAAVPLRRPAPLDPPDGDRGGRSGRRVVRRRPGDRGGPGRGRSSCRRPLVRPPR